MATRRRGVFLTGTPSGVTQVLSGSAVGVGNSVRIPPPQIWLVVQHVLSGAATGRGIGGPTSIQKSGKQLTPAAASIGHGDSTGAVFIRHPLSGSAIGQGLAAPPTSIVHSERFLTGASVGRGNSTGTLVRRTVLSGASVGTGISGTGQITTNHSLVIAAGSPIGVGSSTGTLSDQTPLFQAAAPVGRGIAAGAIVNVHSLSGSAIGRAISGTATPLILGHKLSGSAIGVGISRGANALSNGKQLSGSSIGQGISNGTLTRRVRLNGASIGQGISSGVLVRRQTLSGNAIGRGNAFNSITFVRHVLTPLIAPVGLGNSTGTVSRQRSLTPAATSIGTGIGAGTLVKQRVLIPIAAGSVGVGISRGTAAFTVFHKASGASVGVGISTGIVQKSGAKLITVAVPAVGQGISTGTLRLRHVLTGTSIGQGISTGTINNGTSITYSYAPAFDTGLVTAFDPRWFHPATVHTFTVFAKLSGGASVAVRLWNVTDSVAVAGTALVFVNTTATEMESPALTGVVGFPQLEKNYRAEVGVAGGSSGVIFRARIASKGI